MTTLTLSTATQRFDPINKLVVFGDSLSDTGTVFRATGGLYPPNPPYFQGRYSNGRVWVEYLADRLQLTPNQISNFAYGGATTGNDSTSLVPSLLGQVQTFTKTNPEADVATLYVLWAGANDYLQGTSSVSAPVANLTKAIDALTTTGVRRILVANLPDLGQLPSTRTSPQATALNTLTQTHNQALRRALKVLSQQADLQIAFLDVNTLYREAITDSAKFNLANVTSACLTGSRACSNPDRFLFWDGIHPTTAAHRILGETAFSVIQDSGMVSSRSMVFP